MQVIILEPDLVASLEAVQRPTWCRRIHAALDRANYINRLFLERRHTAGEIKHGMPYAGDALGNLPKHLGRQRRHKQVAWDHRSIVCLAPLTQR
jgi:hypothetical protein